MSDSPSQVPGPPPTDTPPGEAFAAKAARLMADSHCEDLCVLDLRGLSSVTDFFVVATGTSDRQIHSVAEDLKALSRQEDQGIYGTNGMQRGASSWIVVDCVDVVIHLFENETRSYYDLESMWSDARSVDWESMTTPGQFAKLRR